LPPGHSRSYDFLLAHVTGLVNCGKAVALAREVAACPCSPPPPDPLGGVGRAIMEWVLAMGFLLEQVFRNKQVRRDIRNRVREWVI
jgi:hypothetical protein